MKGPTRKVRGACRQKFASDMTSFGFSIEMGGTGGESTNDACLLLCDTSEHMSVYLLANFCPSLVAPMGVAFSFPVVQSSPRH